MKKKITSVSAILIVIVLLAAAVILAKVFLLEENKKEIKLRSSLEQIQDENSLGSNNANEKNSVSERDNLAVSQPEKTSGEVINKESQNVADSKNSVKEEKNDAIKIIPHLVSWGHQSAKNRSVNAIIIHSSYNALGGDVYDFSKILSEYKGIDVSPHYLIDRAGKIYQLVADADIAYHAGESKMSDGRKSVNNFSIGIEMMNTKKDKCTDEQYSLLKKLISYLKNKYSIKDILGHSQIAPGRKDDPWNFDWGRVK